MVLFLEVFKFYRYTTKFKYLNGIMV